MEGARVQTRLRRLAAALPRHCHQAAAIPTIAIAATAVPECPTATMMTAAAITAIEIAHRHE